MKTKTITIRLPAQLAATIQYAARAERRSVNGQIVHALGSIFSPLPIGETGKSESK